MSLDRQAPLLEDGSIKQTPQASQTAFVPSLSSAGSPPSKQHVTISHNSSGNFYKAWSFSKSVFVILKKMFCPLQKTVERTQSNYPTDKGLVSKNKQKLWKLNSKKNFNWKTVKSSDQTPNRKVCRKQGCGNRLRLLCHQEICKLTDQQDTSVRVEKAWVDVECGEP